MKYTGTITTDVSGIKMLENWGVDTSTYTKNSNGTYNIKCTVDQSVLDNLDRHWRKFYWILAPVFTHAYPVNLFGLKIDLGYPLRFSVDTKSQIKTLWIGWFLVSWEHSPYTNRIEIDIAFQPSL